MEKNGLPTVSTNDIKYFLETGQVPEKFESWGFTPQEFKALIESQNYNTQTGM